MQVVQKQHDATKEDTEQTNILHSGRRNGAKFIR